MSRIGKQVITLPLGVTATQAADSITLRGPQGELTFRVHPSIVVTVAADSLSCAIHPEHATGRPARAARALWGTTRARLNNMVQGVTEGWRKELRLEGVGYRAALKGKDLELAVGYSHHVMVPAPKGISFSVEKELITVAGSDKVLVGQVAADIRAVRKPEPYKGKGIRYKDEIVRRKVGKVAGTAE